MAHVPRPAKVQEPDTEYLTRQTSNDSSKPLFSKETDRRASIESVETFLSFNSAKRLPSPYETKRDYPLAPANEPQPPPYLAGGYNPGRIATPLSSPLQRPLGNNTLPSSPWPPAAASVHRATSTTPSSSTITAAAAARPLPNPFLASDSISRRPSLCPSTVTTSTSWSRGGYSANYPPFSLSAFPMPPNLNSTYPQTPRTDITTFSDPGPVRRHPSLLIPAGKLRQPSQFHSAPTTPMSYTAYHTGFLAVPERVAFPIHPRASPYNENHRWVQWHNPSPDVPRSSAASLVSYTTGKPVTLEFR
ncbi:hypothetical protein VNI00_008193 [Paramarasmius palmivorus]|uniref:Uncharacterized protein n=1 Tax=Paramarasmius palmivorus TaxID=297713 RepID=A0AAW0CZF5_9AGAR